MSGVAGWKSVEPIWGEVDALIEHSLIPPDPIMEQVLDRCSNSGLPDIAVSPAQGKLLEMLVKIAGAKQVLEIGTLGAYSTIWLARGVGQTGHVTTIESESSYAKVARENLKLAQLASRVDVRIGEALDVLELLTGPFDLTFIDADKVNNCAYVNRALRLSKPGALMVVDNVVRQGDILDPQDESAVGTRELYEMLLNHPRLECTALQTVGAKGWDGMLFARVR